MNDRDTADAPKATSELVENGSVMMLMTMVGSEHSSRPVTCASVDSDELWFLVDRTTEWVQAIERGSAITHVTMSDRGENRYLALNGEATVTTDRTVLDRLWTPIAKVWFSGPDDPNLAAVRFEASDGEYWDGPSTGVGRSLALLKGMVTGHEGAVGDHGSIRTETGTSSTAR